jgi:hypothetical protein
LFVHFFSISFSDPFFLVGVHFGEELSFSGAFPFLIVIARATQLRTSPGFTKSFRA